MMLLLCHQCRCLLMIREMKELIVDGCILCVFFLLSSRLRSSAMSVVFDFSDSLNNAAPAIPIWFPAFKQLSLLYQDTRL